MKNFKLLVFSFGIVAIVVLACNKETAYQTNLNTIIDNSKQFSGSASTVSICDQFAYPDTIFYLKPNTATDYIVKPITALTGTFGAFPSGLRINSLSGNINVTRSEAGLDYRVWFVPQGTNDTCIKYITISGVDYDDTVYVMSQGPSIGAPIYNATPSLPVDCSGGCEFDDGPDDDNGNGTADEPLAGQQLKSKGFVINKLTGAINFKKSIQNGVLGANPVSGTSKEFVLYYRIGDKSAKALNKIAFELFYYRKKSEIPQELLDDLSEKQDMVLEEGEEESGDDSGGHGGHGGDSGSGSSSFRVATASSGTTSKSGEIKCRPPYIIVTQQ